MTFQLQDLECAKCESIKAEHMALSCTCSGLYKDKLRIQAYQQKLQTFANIASYHEVWRRSLGSLVLI